MSYSIWYEIRVLVKEWYTLIYVQNEQQDWRNIFDHYPALFYLIDRCSNFCLIGIKVRSRIHFYFRSQVVGMLKGYI